MDVQIKRGLLEICVLKVLVKDDSYGYQIIKDVEEHIQISESTLYPILKRLEKDKHVETYSVEHNSRLRKYYKITKSGNEKIKKFIEDWKNVEQVIEFLKEGL